MNKEFTLCIVNQLQNRKQYPIVLINTSIGHVNERIRLAHYYKDIVPRDAKSTNKF